MAIGRRLQKKTSSSDSQTPAPSLFQSRPFVLDSQPQPLSTQVQETPELQTKQEPGQPSGDRLSRIEISPPSPIQPKLTFGTADRVAPKADWPQLQRSPGESFQHQAFGQPPIWKTIQRQAATNMNTVSQRESLAVRLQSDRSTIQRDTDNSSATQPQIASEDIEYEIIAHRFAYQGDHLPPAAGDWLSTRGYQRDWTLTIRGEGCFVGLLMPLPNSGRTPILAFKGTSPNDSADLLADLDPIAIGFVAFKQQQKKVAKAIALAGGKVDVVGHSLGGALAQHAASAFPNKVGRVVTFQAPAINRIQSYMFGKLDESQRPEVRHHIATGDLVDLAGGKHLAGEVLLHQVGMSPSSHTKYLLNSDAFKEQRESLGLTDEVLEGLGVKKHKAKHTGKVEQFEEYPYWFRQILTEWGGRSLLGLVPGAVLSAYRGGKKLASGIASGASYVGDKISSGASSIYNSTRDFFKNLF